MMNRNLLILLAMLMLLPSSASAQTYAVPKNLPLERAAKREFRKWHISPARYPGLIPEEFFPIGWSKDGKFAYYYEPVDEACGCYFANLVIQDMRTDRVLWEFEYRQDDHTDANGNMPPEDNIQKLWRKNAKLFSDKLLEHAIVPGGSVLLAKTFTNRGRTYTAKAVRNMGKNPDFGEPRVDRLTFTLTTPRLGTKTLYMDDHSKEEYWFMLDAAVLGVIKSPFEDRVAVIGMEVMRGWEGPPHTGDVRIVGADLGSGFGTGARSEAAKYPANWFAWVSDPNKPTWEILPQDAKPGEVILSKRNELGILSNFSATPFVMDGKRYASVEGFWQMMLYPEGPNDERGKDGRVTWKHTREQVAQMTAFEAKSAGELAEDNMKTLGIDWVTYNGNKLPYRSVTPSEHYKLIVAAMRAKLEQNPEVRRILLATGDLILKPDHHGEENPPPEWKYNEIWMQLRSELQKRAR